MFDFSFAPERRGSSCTKHEITPSFNPCKHLAYLHIYLTNTRLFKDRNPIHVGTFIEDRTLKGSVVVPLRRYCVEPNNSVFLSGKIPRENLLGS